MQYLTLIRPDIISALFKFKWVVQRLAVLGTKIQMMIKKMGCWKMNCYGHKNIYSTCMYQVKKEMAIHSLVE